MIHEKYAVLICSRIFFAKFPTRLKAGVPFRRFMDEPIINQAVTDFYAKNAHEGYSDDYDRQHSGRIDWVIKRFGLDKITNQRILDVGAGRGNFFKRMDPSNTFVGLDGAKIGPEGKLCPFLSLRVDLSQPFSYILDNEERFDWIVCSEVLEHIAGIDNILLEMKKLLKVHGKAVFTIPDSSVTHPVAFPGLFYPHQNFVTFIEQYAWLVEEHELYTAGWPTHGFLVCNAPMTEQRPLFDKAESKFRGQNPITWTNL